MVLMSKQKEYPQIIAKPTDKDRMFISKEEAVERNKIYAEQKAKLLQKLSWDEIKEQSKEQKSRGDFDNVREERQPEVAASAPKDDGSVDKKGPGRPRSKKSE